MINVTSFPMCAKRLEFQRVQLDDPAMTTYWAAVNVASNISDEKLAEFGGFDFDDRSEENGLRLLSRLEKYIRQGRDVQAKSDIGGMTEAENSVRAFLGAFGVKVSRLSGIEDYWTAARILWPAGIEDRPKIKDVYTLRFQISRLSKKQRSKSARENRGKLPVQWQAFSSTKEVAA